jgi:hypothetical protein
VYNRLKKHTARPVFRQVLIAEYHDRPKVKIVFVRHRHKRAWLAILTTDIKLADEKIIRIYGKRWDMEVFFKIRRVTCFYM